MPDDDSESPPADRDETVTDPTRETSIEEAARPDDGGDHADREPEEGATPVDPDAGGTDPGQDTPPADDAAAAVAAASASADTADEADDGADPEAPDADSEGAETDDVAEPDSAEGGRDGDTEATDHDAESVDGYAFSDVGDEHWPPRVEYTPKYDDRWVYTVGGRAAGSRDDVPMQGLELQVAAPRDEIAAVVRACMAGLASYEDAVGEVPRHMFVSDAAAFDAVATDGAGTVAVFQPRADDGRDLLKHMTAFREGTTDSADLTPNRERARELAAHLRAALADAGLGADAVATYREAGGPPRPVADGRVYERYAALGAEGLYDPTDGPADVDSPGADGVEALGFEPDYLDVSDPAALRDDATDAGDETTGGHDRDGAADPEPGDETTDGATTDDEGDEPAPATADDDSAGDGAAATEGTDDGETAPGAGLGAPGTDEVDGGDETAEDGDGTAGGPGWGDDGED
jgi:hypothetical protein